MLELLEALMIYSDVSITNSILTEIKKYVTKSMDTQGSTKPTILYSQPERQ
jgi:hypothetical protein